MTEEARLKEVIANLYRAIDERDARIDVLKARLALERARHRLKALLKPTAT